MAKILIIDDDQELTDLLEEFLSDFKYQTTVYHEPLAALKYLEKNTVDLILLDIMLPEMDGFQVLRKIRESAETPVMMVANRVRNDEMGESLFYKMNLIVSKFLKVSCLFN